MDEFEATFDRRDRNADPRTIHAMVRARRALEEAHRCRASGDETSEAYALTQALPYLRLVVGPFHAMAAQADASIADDAAAALKRRGGA
jgi:hypothetical protein